jgi:hypothetical protein
VLLHEHNYYEHHAHAEELPLSCAFVRMQENKHQEGTHAFRFAGAEKVKKEKHVWIDASIVNCSSEGSRGRDDFGFIL